MCVCLCVSECVFLSPFLFIFLSVSFTKGRRMSNVHMDVSIYPQYKSFELDLFGLNYARVSFDLVIGRIVVQVMQC